MATDHQEAQKDDSKGPTSSSLPCWEEVKYLITNFVFLAAYFLPIVLLAGVYLAWCGYVPRLVGILLIIATILDYIVPLPKRPHFHEGYCRATGMSKGMQKYCNAELRLKAKFEKDKQYLLALSPHGLWPQSYHLLWPQMIDRFGITPLVMSADIILMLPFFKRHFAAFGCIPANSQDVRWALEQKYPFNCMVMVPGGISEMFYGQAFEQIIARKRKGFVKLALEKGAHIVPAYGFGANQQYYRLCQAGGLLHKISSALKISVTPWVDRFNIPFGPIPTKHKVLLAVGEPIPVEKVEKPTDAQVNELHEKYLMAMKALFNEYKGEMGWQDKELYFEDETPGKKKTQ